MVSHTDGSYFLLELLRSIWPINKSMIFSRITPLVVIKSNHIGYIQHFISNRYRNFRVMYALKIKVVDLALDNLKDVALV